MAKLPRIFADAPIAQDIPDARLGLGAALAPAQAFERGAAEVGQLGLQVQHMGVQAMIAKQNAARPIEARKLYADAIDEINGISENLRMDPHPLVHGDLFAAHFDDVMRRTMQKTNDPKIQEWLQEHLLSIKPERLHQERQFENRNYIKRLELADLETQRRLIDQAARAKTDTERGKIMSEVVKMNGEQVRLGRRTPEQAMARIESAFEQVGSTQVMDLIKTNPAAAVDMLKQGIGASALLKPKRREELVNMAYAEENRVEIRRRQAQTEAEHEATRVSRDTMVELVEALDIRRADPRAVLELAYARNKEGRLTEQHLLQMRTITKEKEGRETEEGNPFVYADVMANVRRNTGKYSETDLAQLRADGQLDKGQMQEAIRVRINKEEQARDRAERRGEAERREAERKFEGQAKAAAAILSRDINREARVRGTDVRIANHILTIAEDEIQNLLLESKFTAADVPKLREKYLPLLGGRTSADLAKRLDPRFSSMLDLERIGPDGRPNWQSKGLQPWEYERERQIRRLYDRQLTIEGNTAEQKAYQDANKAYREFWFPSIRGIEAPKKPEAKPIPKLHGEEEPPPEGVAGTPPGTARTPLGTSR